MAKALLVNLFGVPGAGKTSGMAQVFAALKVAGINAEMVSEFAKDKVWEGSKKVFENQLYILGKQCFRISRCEDEVDVIITDSPMLLSVFYNTDNKYGEHFNPMVIDLFHSYKTLNYLILRDKEYNPKGRFQTEEESDALLEPMYKLLSDCRVRYSTMPGTVENYHRIALDIIQYLEDKKNN